MLTDLVRTQVAAFASMPVSAARLLAALADAAEASVGVLQQLDERAAATNRVLHSFEDPLVRIAEAVDASLVESTVEALSRLPTVLAGAAALAERLDVGRLGGLVDRLEESIPGLIRLPDTENEVRRLRETLDRMYRVFDELQGRFGAFPGAGLLLRRSAADGGRGGLEATVVPPDGDPAPAPSGKKPRSKAKDGRT